MLNSYDLCMHVYVLIVFPRVKSPHHCVCAKPILSLVRDNPGQCSNTSPCHVGPCIVVYPKYILYVCPILWLWCTSADRRLISLMKAVFPCSSEHRLHEDIVETSTVCT